MECFSQNSLVEFLNRENYKTHKTLKELAAFYTLLRLAGKYWHSNEFKRNARLISQHFTFREKKTCLKKKHSKDGKSLALLTKSLPHTYFTLQWLYTRVTHLHQFKQLHKWYHKNCIKLYIGLWFLWSVKVLGHATTLQIPVEGHYKRYIFPDTPCYTWNYCYTGWHFDYAKKQCSCPNKRYFFAKPKWGPQRGTWPPITPYRAITHATRSV